MTQSNPRFLNAEDQTTLNGLEVCVDLALLDPKSEIAVMRGGPVDHPKYKGRRVFGAGINLTHLYHGRIPFVWYLERDIKARSLSKGEAKRRRAPLRPLYRRIAKRAPSLDGARCDPS